MKKLLGLFMIGAGLSINAHAQKHTGEDVPAAVKTAFAQQFPGTTARWVKTGEQYEAHFKHRRQEISAVYNADGTLSETEHEIEVWQLPLPVIDYVEQHYGGSIREAAKVTKANGEINYEATVKGKEVLFDASCAFLKEEAR
jgi:uncharacterized iron-regulated protein